MEIHELLHYNVSVPKPKGKTGAMTDDAGQKLALPPNDLQVLQILRRSKEPLSAYDIMAKFKGGRVAPPTVYRALSHLIEAGLVHRLESRNAFVACKHKKSCLGPAIFMLCGECGKAIEYRDQEIETYLRAAAHRQHFDAQSFTLELKGICSACAQSATPAESAAL